jgi:DNA-binding beta-propeller fold protein YncE
MRFKMFPFIVLTALLAIAFFPSGCAGPANCPLCGTTQNDAVTIIDVMGVPGAAGPGGTAFTVFDLGLVDTANHRYYVTDRSQNGVLVYDTLTDTPVLIPNGGGPGVAAAGTIGSGAFTGAILRLDRAANFNPLTGPNGVIVTPGGSTKFGLVWVSDGDSTVKVFDAATGVMMSKVFTGVSADFTGSLTQDGIDACIRGTNPASCGDFRADETSFDPADNILLVTNGDPGVPFATLIDTKNPACAGNSCVLAQIFFDGLSGSTCPPGTGVAGASQPPVPCAHANAAFNGLGGSAFNPKTGKFLVANSQTISPGNFADSEIAVIDPKTLKVTAFPLTGAGCQPSFVVIGPPPNVLVACENFNGPITFRPSEIVIDGGTGKIIQVITQVGGVDQAAFNSTDNRYYVAARDNPTGPVLGVIDAVTNTWLQNVPTGSNAHSVAADPTTNHIFVPLQPSASCRAFATFGCIAVYAAQ